MYKFSALVVAAVLVSAAGYAADKGKTTTLEGKLVSASCYMSDHSRTGNDMGDAKDCGKHCLEMGKSGGLLTNDNNFYILDVSSLKVAPYVGQTIRVTGLERSKDIFSVRTVDVKKGDNWQAVDLGAKKDKGK